MKPEGKNIFGGKNKNSLYTPMSEIEQEFISRVHEAGDFRIHVLDWGVVNAPRLTLGDLRASFVFNLNFTAPAVPQNLWYLDLELRHSSGQLFFKERQPTTVGGQPMLVGAGMALTLAWDIAVKAMDNRLIKSLMPGVLGLTSRLQDRDTGDITLLGNMKLNSVEKKALNLLRRGEASVRDWSRNQVKKAGNPR